MCRKSGAKVESEADSSRLEFSRDSGVNQRKKNLFDWTHPAVAVIAFPPDNELNASRRLISNPRSCAS